MADSLVTPFDIARADALDGVPHGFFGSADGAHQFGFGGPGEEKAVQDLRAAAAAAVLPGAVPVAPHQVHSPDVATVDEAWPDMATGRPVADAVVTARCGFAIGIVTADCAPVLFADTGSGVIGAAHAGWRGAQGGVLENTIAAMQALGARPERMIAAIGPTIARSSYEIDAGFRQHFDPRDELHFTDAPMREGVARWTFDLPGYILARLSRAGMAQAVDTGLDTFANKTRYHSYRRAIQQGAASYGRQLSIIALA